MSAEIDREIAEPEDDEADAVTGPEDTDLTQGETPAQSAADDAARAPEEEGGEDPQAE